MKPTESEPICVVSYEITGILVGGGPEERPGFWKAYRRELEFNRNTHYNNYHIKLCKHHLTSMKRPPSQPVYFRNNRLTPERALES